MTTWLQESVENRAVTKFSYMIIDLLRLLEDPNSAHGNGLLLRISHIIPSLKNPLTAKMNKKVSITTSLEGLLCSSSWWENKLLA